MSRVLCGARHVGRGLFDALAELGAARMAPPRDALEAAHRLAGALGTIAKAHEIHVDVAGDVPRGPALIVSNHVSYLDPLALLPLCPAVPIAKGEVERWPVIGSIGAALGVAFVRRADPMARARVLRRVHALLAARVPVLSFPEGTTTRGDEVRPFFRGTFGIAQRLGLPVIPVALRYRDRALAWTDDERFVPHYLRTAALSRIDVRVWFGAAMLPRTGELPEDMAARARNTIARTLTRWNDARIRVRVSPSRPDTVLPTSRVA